MSSQRKKNIFPPKGIPSKPVAAASPKLSVGSEHRMAIFAAGVLIVLVALAAYFNTFSVPFLNDDEGSITENATIRHLWPIGDALSPPHADGVTVGGRPMLNLSLAVNYAISGPAVWSYHALNLIIHIFAGLVLFGIVRRTLLRPVLRERFGQMALPLALASALLWTVHPLQTESVTYIVQRAESLMGLFYLLTLYCFVRAVESRKPVVWLTLSMVACLLGMASKEVMVSAPLMVWLYDRTFVAGTFRKAWRQHGRYYFGLAATWLVLGWLVIGTGGRGGTAGFGTEVTWWAYALTQFGAITHYLWLTVWPQNLIFTYGTELAKPGIEIVPYVLLVVLLAAGTLTALRRAPGIGFLGAWFFLVLAPSSSVVPVATETMAEHRMYLALAPVVVLAVLGVYRLIGKGSVVVSLALALVLAWLTFHRNETYRSALAIWSDTVVKCPNNPQAHNNLGIALADQGRTGEAIAQYQTAIAIKPDYAEAYNNLGNSLLQNGRVNEAVIQFQNAIKTEPNNADIHNNFGKALLQNGRVDEAVIQFQNALAIQPNHAKAENNLGSALIQKRRPDEAAVHWQKALAIEPDFAGADYNLGHYFLQKGQVDEAIIHLQKALAIQSDFVEAQNDLGRTAWIMATSPDSSVRNGIKAVEIAQQIDRLSGGKNPLMAGTLAAAYAEAGKFPEAIAAGQRALQLASGQKNDALAATIQQEIKLYEAGTPLRAAKP
jgi:tetratricopeptide (TPR) repeat protein